MAAPVGVRHQHPDVFSKWYSVGIAKLPLRRAAEELDDAVFIDDDHRVRNGVEDRTKVSLAYPQSILEALLLVDIDYNSTEPCGFAIDVVYDCAECAHPVSRV